MKLLAWDTSSKVGALVALEWNPDSCKSWKDVRLVAELALNVELTHSERLLWGIHQVLESARWNIKDIDGFGVGVGPGSFTGLRIGLTTGRTLAHTLNKPLISVSSLAALVSPVAMSVDQRSSLPKTVIVGTTDACKGELFALWGDASDIRNFIKSPQECVREQVLSPKKLVQSIQMKLDEFGPHSHWIAVGEGRKRYLEEWSQLPGERELVLDLPYTDFVQGRYLGLLAWESFQSKMNNDPLSVHPQYLRASDAELKLKNGK